MNEIDENDVNDDFYGLEARTGTNSEKDLIGKNDVRKFNDTYETGENGDKFDFEYGTEKSIGKNLIGKNNGTLGKKGVRKPKQNKKMYDEMFEDDGYEMGSGIEMIAGKELIEKSEERVVKKPGRKPKAKNNDSYEKYEEADIITFIRKVEEKQVLWDASLKAYHRTETGLKLFDEIEKACSRFMPRGKNAHGSCAMKLWKELSNDYKMYVKKHQKAASGSGVSALPSFRFASHMSFLDIAVEKRQVKNAFIIGSGSHYTAESDDDFGDDNEEVEEDDFLKKNPMDGLALETPKRKRSYNDVITPKKPRRQTQVDELLRQLDESNCSIMSAVNDIKSENMCNTERICKTFQKHVENWEEVDRFNAEAEVLRFIKTLKPSEPPSNYHHHQNHQSQRVFPNSSSQIPPMMLRMDPNSPSPFSTDFTYYGYNNNLFDC